MAGIAKAHSAHPVEQLWLAPGTGVMARLAEAMVLRQAHPSRTLVLLPYFQLVPLARQMWARWVAQPAATAAGAAFVPRFDNHRLPIERLRLPRHTGG